MEKALKLTGQPLPPESCEAIRQAEAEVEAGTLNGRDLYLIEIALGRFIQDLEKDAKRNHSVERRRREVAGVLGKIKLQAANL